MMQKVRRCLCSRTDLSIRDAELTLKNRNHLADIGKNRSFLGENFVNSPDKLLAFTRLRFGTMRQSVPAASQQPDKQSR